MAKLFTREISPRISLAIIWVLFSQMGATTRFFRPIKILKNLFGQRMANSSMG